MKRLDLVQLTIIIVGIFSGFYFILSLPQFLIYLFSWFSEGLTGGTYMMTLVWNIVVSGAYLLSAIYCIKKSKHFAEWICRNGDLNADINFALDKSEILFVLFTGLGIYGLITRLPTFVTEGVNYIKGRNSSGLFDNEKIASSSNLIIQVITLSLFFILVYYAKVFSDFLAPQINNPEPEDTIASKTED